MNETNGHNNHCHCAECDVDQMARNNYFTGKLMVERDFTDEQRYFRGKLQRHNHNLHGTGVVCGLKVVAHPNPACQAVYVIIEPGTAIDCCGHEIIVPDQLNGQVISNVALHGVLFNFAAAPEVKKLMADAAASIDSTRPKAHTLQFCLRYKECESESIPVLYDDCGCDGAKCAPNRILESFEIDVMVDRQTPADDPGSIKLAWNNTILLAHSKALALDENAKRMFVLSSTNPGMIRSVSTQNYITSAPDLALPAAGLALALANDASHLYIAIPVTGTAAVVSVLNPDKLTDAASATLQAGTAKGDIKVLAVAPDDRVVAVYSSGDVAIWNDATVTGIPSTIVNVTPVLRDIAFSSNGKNAYGADATGPNTVALDLTTATPTESSLTIDAAANPAAVPFSITIISSTAGDIIALSDKANRKFYLTSIDGTNLIGSVGLKNFPIALAASPGGNWVYALTQDDPANPTEWFIEPISVTRVQQKKPNAVGAAVAVGQNASQLVLSKSGTTLYVAYDGDPAVPASGGIAILDVTKADCGGLLQQDCTSCDSPDCVVLATVVNYHLDDALNEAPDSQLVSAYDPNNPIAFLDNSTRRLLPSTQVLTEVVQCMLENCCGGGTGGQGATGATGPTGPIGPTGAGIDQVIATAGPPVPDGTVLPATITGTTPNRTLNLTVPRGNDGNSGSQAAKQIMTGLVNISVSPGKMVMSKPFKHCLLKRPVGILLAVEKVDGKPLGVDQFESINLLGAAAPTTPKGLEYLAAQVPSDPFNASFKILVQYTPLTEGGSHVLAIRWIAMTGDDCTANPND